MNHYDILRAIKTGYAPDHYTALYARSMSGGSKEYERYISGTPPLILSKSVGKPLVSWSITGNTIQDGEPTPENPVEVKGVGDKTGNLTKISSAYFPMNKSTHYYLFDGWLDAGTYTISCFQETEMSENVRNTFGVNIGDTGVQYQNTSPNRHLKKGTYSYTFTVSKKSITKVELWITGNIVDVNCSKVMLNKGTVPLPYEPFGIYRIPVTASSSDSSIVANIYLDTSLMAYEKLISDGTREFKWGKMILTGDESWIHPSSSELFYITDLPIDYNKRLNNPESNYYSTHFAPASASTSSAGMKEGEIRFYNGVVNTNEMYIKILGIDTVDAFKTWLRQQSENGTPVIVYYQLANPLTESFDVPEIPTVKGNCTIDVDTEVQPKNMTIEYLSSVKDTAMSEMISLLNEV